MNIYIMTTIVNGFTSSDIIVNLLDICGIIALNQKSGECINEYYDYQQYCRENGIHYIPLETYSINSEMDKKMLSELKVDLLLVLGWQRLIPEWLIDQCTLGAIGVHGSPWGISGGRGRSPQNWALLLGMKDFYISIFWIDAMADAGDVIDTAVMSYTDIDDINTSYLKCGILTADMIIKNIENGRVLSREGSRQGTDASYLPQRSMEDGEIDWYRSGKDIYNFVRALTKPYPGAFTRLGETIVQIWHVIYLNVKSEIWNDQPAGKIVQIQPDGRLLVKCKDGLILVDDYQISGKGQLNKGDLFKSADFKKQISRIVRKHYSKYNNAINAAIMELIS